MKYLITGSSGFIGTNLVEFLKQNKNIDILGIDTKKPKINRHCEIWKQIDLLDINNLTKTVLNFNPDYVIHLAARTDLRGKSLLDYNANIQGVLNLSNVLSRIPDLKRVIFTSSMYVCRPGYIPEDFEDYAPHTLYGKSKAETEKIVKSADLPYIWTLIRPTSIWGPWFEEPYNKFFHMVLSRSYFHIKKRNCKKTYGYIDNTIYQILSIIEADAKKINRKIFYLGDYEAYDIREWANEIASCKNIKIKTVSFLFFKLAAWFGDFLKLFGVTFPMTSFRLKNMTTDNIHNLSSIKEIAPNLPITRNEGTKKTVQWIESV